MYKTDLMFKKIWYGGQKCHYIFKKYNPNVGKTDFMGKPSPLMEQIMFSRYKRDVPLKKDYFWVKMRLNKSSRW